MKRPFMHPLAGIALQQTNLINLDRARRKRDLLALEKLLDEAELVLADVDSVSDGLCFDDAVKK